MEFATEDSIVAIATAPGRGGLGVVRISGPDALSITRQLLDRTAALEPRRATFAHVLAPRPDEAVSRRPPRSRQIADEVIVTYFQAPASYTGQDIVEISAHGSPVVLRDIVQAAVDAGARLARPGEFTLRAFLSGKRDLVQAEAVADLIAAATPLQARTAFDQLEGTLTQRIGEIDAELFDLIARLEASLDFPDEGYHFVTTSDLAAELERSIDRLDRLLGDAARGRMIREGATVVIAGRPNVGKSSVFNALAGSHRAIVTPVPGTTRDLVTEVVDVGGIPVTLVDTAGWRETSDVVESEGVNRGEQARKVGDLILVVFDRSSTIAPEDERLLEATSDQRRLLVLNKIDLERALPALPATIDAIEVSAMTGAGVGELHAAIARTLTGAESLREPAAVSNARHVALLEDVRQHVSAALGAVGCGDTPEEFVLADLQAARLKLDEIVGARTSEDVLRHIFDRFCIGK